MKSNDSHDAEQLKTLELWRNSQLDRAQAAYGKCKQATESCEQAVMKVAGAIEEAREIGRSLLENRGRLSPDMLECVRRYAAVKQSELEAAHRELTESKRALGDAHKEVVDKFASLSVVSRLRERREEAGHRETQRIEQHRMDDQAMLRGARTISQRTAPLDEE